MTWLEDPPLLVVEVLSPSTRREDLGPESDEYAEGGVAHFWVADPDRRTLDLRTILPARD